MSSTEPAAIRVYSRCMMCMSAETTYISTFKSIVQFYFHMQHIYVGCVSQCSFAQRSLHLNHFFNPLMLNLHFFVSGQKKTLHHPVPRDMHLNVPWVNGSPWKSHTAYHGRC